MDNSTLSIITVCFLSSFVSTCLITPVIIKLYRRSGWDRPHSGHRQAVKDTHHGNIPRGGGLTVFCGILISLLPIGAFLMHFALESIKSESADLGLAAVVIIGLIAIQVLFAKVYLPLLFSSLLLTVTGWLDDIRDLSPWSRLVVNIVASIIVVIAGIQINFVTNPFGGVFELTFWSWLPPVLTIFYLVALTNIVNWSKGVDGQMPGVVAIAAAWVGFLAIRSGEYALAMPVAFIVSGAFAGFLIWNFYPQKIMPGYGGGSLAGFLLAVISIMAGAKIATLFMVLALPIADATFTILRRFIAGKSIFLGDRGHLHHKLLDRLHWGRRRIAIFYWCVTLLMGMLASILPTWGKIIAFLLVVVLVFAFLIYMKLSSQTAQKVV